MARKKKNKNSQTFDVYPYLDQYQYLMRDGGALPWYQTKGPVRGGDAAGKPVRPNANDDAYKGNSQAFMKALNQYYTDLGVWEEENNIPEDQREKNNVNRNEKDEGEAVDPTKVHGAKTECTCPEGYEKAGTTYYASGEDCRFDVNCGTKTEEVDVEEVDVEEIVEEPGDRAKAIQDYKDGLISREELDKVLNSTEEVTDETDGSGSGEGYELDEVEETTTGPPVQKSKYEQAVQDYKDGKISRRELDDLTQRYNVDGKRSSGYKSGNTQFETLPGTPLHLLANALQSTGKAISRFGKSPINPKTGKPYEKQDFKKTSIDWSKIKNQNDAGILYKPDVLRDFVGGNDDLNVDDLIGSQTTFEAQNFNKFQEDRTQMDIDQGVDRRFSKQTMSKYDGTTSYDDLANESYDPDVHGSMPNNPMFQKTRKHRGEEDLTAGDIAERNLKDMSATEIIFDKDGTPVQYKGFGGTGSGEGSTGTWDYDPNKQYGDYEEIVITNKQEKLNNVRKGLNEDGTDPSAEEVIDNVPDGATEVSRVTNEDFSVTITYDDGTEKTMNESPQAKKNRERLAKENNPEGKIGLETFVYGGQPSGNKLSFTDIYAKGGDILKWYEHGGEHPEDDEKIVDELLDTDDEEVVNFTEEEIDNMGETSLEDSEIVESTYGTGMQGVKNKFGAITKTGIGGKINETWGNLGQAGADIADFGNSLFSGWNRSREEAIAENEGNTASDMFTVQDTSQGIYDVNSGDGWTNEKVDEIYAGNTMKGPKIMQAGGPPTQQAPVEEELNYTALSQFSDNNTWDSEVSYSPEVIAYQKKIMGKMRDGGSLPSYQAKGEKVNQLLEYIPGFPRTGGAEFGPGGFNAEQYQNAITRDSTLLNNYIIENPWSTYFAGSNQDHASSAGSLSGDIQLNREWLHKLQMQDDQEAAAKLNFYKRGGQLPSFQSKGEIPIQQKILRDIRKVNLEAEGIEPSQIDSIETVRYIQDVWPKFKASGFSMDDVIRHITKNRPDLIERKGHVISNIRGMEGLPEEKYGGGLPKAQDGKEDKPWYSKVADYTQTALSGVGLTPGPVGFVADAVNTAVSGTRAGYNSAIGDTESAKIHGENLALNATSMIPGPAGWIAGGTALAKDTANYAGITDSDKSVTTQVAEAVTPSVQVADATPVGGNKGKGFDFNKTRDFTSKKDDSKIDKVAKHGGEQIVDVDYETLQELIKAGADIEII